MQTMLSVFNDAFFATKGSEIETAIVFGVVLTPKPPLCKGRWLAEQDGGVVRIALFFSAPAVGAELTRLKSDRADDALERLEFER